MAIRTDDLAFNVEQSYRRVVHVWSSYYRQYTDSYIQFRYFKTDVIAVLNVLSFEVWIISRVTV